MYIGKLLVKAYFFNVYWQVFLCSSGLGKVNQWEEESESFLTLLNEQYSCFVCSTVVMALLRLGMALSIMVLAHRLT